MGQNDNKHPRVVGFQLIERIGGGGFSTVYKAVNFESHRVAACKVIPLTEATTAQDRKALDKEIRVHTAMKHTNVLEFFNAVIVEDDGRTKYFPAIYMLMELASGGDLFDKIAPEIGVDEELAHFFFTQLVAGINYIHQQGVCHRDLKPENLLLDVAGRLKISDFGLCSVFKHKETGRVRLLTERCGSLPYVAPELSHDEPYEAEPVDIWGMGVILFTLLVGNTPWDEPTRKSHEFRRYVRGETYNDDPWNRIGEDPLSLIKGILHIDPRKRLSMHDIMAHHWVMRPSQVAREGQAKLAQRLTRSLQDAGDMEVIDPHKTITQDDYDGDEDTMTASYHSQFTQSLLLFSQTQSGMRYTPHLTRFYAKLEPRELMELIEAALVELGVKSKPSQIDPSSPERLRLRVGGFDRRKEMFKGWFELEPFQYHEKAGTFCVLQRDQGNPISWRQLWKSIVQFPTIDTHVFKRS